MDARVPPFPLSFFPLTQTQLETASRRQMSHEYCTVLGTDGVVLMVQGVANIFQFKRHISPQKKEIYFNAKI